MSFKKVIMVRHKDGTAEELEHTTMKEVNAKFGPIDSDVYLQQFVTGPQGIGWIFKAEVKIGNLKEGTVRPGDYLTAYDKLF